MGPKVEVAVGSKVMAWSTARGGGRPRGRSEGKTSENSFNRGWMAEGTEGLVVVFGPVLATTKHSPRIAALANTCREMKTLEHSCACSSRLVPIRRWVLPLARIFS